MYQLAWSSGGGAPFRVGKKGTMLSRGGSPVTLLGDVREVVRELHVDDKWRNTVLAVSSRCDEPPWARELLEKFEIDDGEGGRSVLPPLLRLPSVSKGTRTAV